MPTTVMPRFAAAFISFLALQGFATRASNMMARNLALVTDDDPFCFAIVSDYEWKLESPRVSSHRGTHG